MKQTLCDRCGEVIDPPWSSPYLSLRTANYEGIDLCEHCVESFHLWLAEPRAKV